MGPGREEQHVAFVLRQLGECRRDHLEATGRVHPSRDKVFRRCLGHDAFAMYPRECAFGAILGTKVCPEQGVGNAEQPSANGSPTRVVGGSTIDGDGKSLGDEVVGVMFACSSAHVPAKIGSMGVEELSEDLRHARAVQVRVRCAAITGRARRCHGDTWSVRPVASPGCRSG